MSRFVAVVLSVFFASAASAQPTITLDSDGSTYTTLDAAIAAASAAWISDPNRSYTIRIGPGTLVERDISATGLGPIRLNILGTPQQTVIDGEQLPGTFATFEGLGINLTLQDLTIRGYVAGTDASSVLSVSGGDVSISDVVFKDIKPDPDAPTDEVTAVNIGPLSSIGRVSECRIVVDGSGPALDVDGAVNVYNSLIASDGVAANTTERFLMYSCTLDGGITGPNDFGFFHVYYNCIVTELPAITGTMFNCIIPAEPVNPLFNSGSTVADPLFADASNGDYRVSAGSPAIDAAEMDLYDGEFALASFFDANNDFRLVDDPATTDTGTGERSFLDIGAFEYQPPECPADQNFDGMLSPTDFTAWINNYNNGCP